MPLATSPTPRSFTTSTEAELYAQPDVIAMYKSLGIPVPAANSGYTASTGTGVGAATAGSFMADPSFLAWRDAQLAGAQPGSAAGAATPTPTQPQGGATPPANPAAPNWGSTWQQPGQPGTVYGRTGGGANAFTGADELSRLAWQSDPAMAYTRYASQEANPGSHYERWLQSEQARTLRDYVDASRAQHDLYIGDYLQQQAPSLVARYTSLPGWQQGMNAAPTFAGRRL